MSDNHIRPKLKIGVANGKAQVKLTWDNWFKSKPLQTKPVQKAKFI